MDEFSLTNKTWLPVEAPGGGGDKSSTAVSTFDVACVLSLTVNKLVLLLGEAQFYVCLMFAQRKKSKEKKRGHL